MNKEYHQIGSIYGKPVLVEVETDDDLTKALLYDAVKNGVLPKYILVDPEPQARLFEKLCPQYTMPTLELSQRLSKAKATTDVHKNANRGQRKVEG